MTFSRQVLALISLAGFVAGAAATQAASPAHAAQATQLQAPAFSAYYSFADVYRLTVGDAMSEYASAQSQSQSQEQAQVQARPALAAVADKQSKLSAVPDSTPAGYEFSIAAIPQPSGWLLLLSGLALAGWVARRRLGYSF